MNEFNFLSKRESSKPRGLLGRHIKSGGLSQLVSATTCIYLVRVSKPCKPVLV